MLHLAKRFFGSFTKREISDADRDWITSILSIKEMELWSGQMIVDQVH